MIKMNQDIIGEQWIRHNDNLLVVNDEDDETDRKSYHNRRESLTSNTVSGLHHLIAKNMVRGLISKIKNGEDITTIRFLSKMVKW